MTIPSTVTLTRDAKRPRMTADQSGLAVNCLLGKGPRRLSVLHSSGVKGSVGEQWTECSASWGGSHNPATGQMEGAGLYRWVFSVVGGTLQECLVCLSPKGVEYDSSQDGGSAFSEVTIPDRIKLSQMLIREKSGPTKEEVAASQLTEKEIHRQRASVAFKSKKKGTKKK